MVYPIFSYDDGTEVTASKPDISGNVFLYVEKFDEEKDSFVNATFIIPNARIDSYFGYSEEEVNEMLRQYSEVQDDIVDYVKEKVRESA